MILTLYVGAPIFPNVNAYRDVRANAVEQSDLWTPFDYLSVHLSGFAVYAVESEEYIHATSPSIPTVTL